MVVVYVSLELETVRVVRELLSSRYSVYTGSVERLVVVVTVVRELDLLELG